VSEEVVYPGTEAVLRRDVGAEETRQAQRAWWDWHAADYQRAHAEELPAVSFVWCPEGLVEDEAGLLGDVTGRDVLEVGCGAAQCARWLVSRGARAVAFDLSAGQLAQAVELGAKTEVPVPLVQADATALPFADRSFDLACSAYGAIPFVADSAGVMREVFRVLRPGGRWVFSVTHPIRWCFPDDATAAGLVISQSYFDRTPYVETDAAGRATYVEHHRTLGDRVRELVTAGFVVEDLVEPEWRAGHVTTYAQWGGLRGELTPGTAIWVARRPRE
jgi:SAM-dependent methyltransferase